MTASTQGTVLTCSHDHCGCRVLIQEECHCDGSDGQSYMCACGSPMVEASA